MRAVKMRIAGIADDKVFFRPVIILKNNSGKTFPVPSTFQSSSSLIDAFVNKSSVHSELVSKLIELTGDSIDKIVLEKSKNKKLIAKVYNRNKKTSILEMSPSAAILLCIEINKPIMVKLELFKDKSFFKDKVDESGMIDGLSKAFFNGVDQNENPVSSEKERETLQ